MNSNFYIIYSDVTFCTVRSAQNQLKLDDIGGFYKRNVFVYVYFLS